MPPLTTTYSCVSGADFLDRKLRSASPFGAMEMGPANNISVWITSTQLTKKMRGVSGCRSDLMGPRVGTSGVRCWEHAIWAWPSWPILYFKVLVIHCLGISHFSHLHDLEAVAASRITLETAVFLVCETKGMYVALLRSFAEDLALTMPAIGLSLE